MNPSTDLCNKAILMDTLQDDLQAVGRRIAERVRDWSEGELSFLIALPHRNGDRSAFQVIVTRGGLDRPTFVMTVFDVQALGKRLENEFVELLYPDPKPKF